MTDPGSVKSMAEHWDLLWFLVVVLIGVALAELRLAFYNICKKQNRLIDFHNQCQKNLPKEYVTREEFKKLEEDRTKRWEKFFFPHQHHPTGEVKIIRTIENLTGEKK
jgi:hypothetical protein